MVLLTQKNTKVWKHEGWKPFSGQGPTCLLRQNHAVILNLVKSSGILQSITILMVMVSVNDPTYVTIPTECIRRLIIP